MDPQERYIYTESDPSGRVIRGRARNSGGIRRLPVILVLDCSESMAGAAIAAVEDGVRTFAEQARAEETYDEVIAVAVITFNSSAVLVTNGLEPVRDFKPPRLVARGRTKLGKALRLLQQVLDQNVKPCIPGRAKGDFVPLIFILTDGWPDEDDDWRTPRSELLRDVKRGRIKVVTVGCGTLLNEEGVAQLGMGEVFKLHDGDDSFAKYFEWVTLYVTSEVRNSIGAPIEETSAGHAMPDATEMYHVGLQLGSS